MNLQAKRREGVVARRDIEAIIPIIKFFGKPSERSQPMAFSRLIFKTLSAFERSKLGTVNPAYHQSRSVIEREGI